MCCLKNPSRGDEIECKVKNYNKLQLKLTRTSKVNHFIKVFIENKLNLFKT